MLFATALVALAAVGSVFSAPVPSRGGVARCQEVDPEARVDALSGLADPAIPNTPAEETVVNVSKGNGPKVCA